MARFLISPLRAGLRRALRGLAAALDGMIALAALALIWYGIRVREPAWWVVGALVYLPLILMYLRSTRRSGGNEPDR